MPDQQNTDSESKPSLKHYLASAEFSEACDVIESQKQWGIFVTDPKILESVNRKELKEYLEKLLVGIDHRHTTSDTQPFPTSAELDRLTVVVTLLGKMVGIKKGGFGDLLSAMKRIENKFSKTRIIACADKLLEKLCKVPASPRTVLNQAMESCGKADSAKRNLLREIDRFLDTNEGPVNFNAPWEKWHESVKALVFPHSFLSSAGNADGLRKEFNAAVGTHGRLLAFLYFMDLRRLQAEWMIKYAEQTKASLAWIYLLQRPSDFERLKQVYFGTALPPREIRAGLKSLANRESRNRNYCKKAGVKEAGVGGWHLRLIN